MNQGHTIKCTEYAAFAVTIMSVASKVVLDWK